MPEGILVGELLARLRFQNELSAGVAQAKGDLRELGVSVEQSDRRLEDLGRSSFQTASEVRIASRDINAFGTAALMMGGMLGSASLAAEQMGIDISGLRGPLNAATMGLTTLGAGIHATSIIMRAKAAMISASLIPAEIALTTTQAGVIASDEALAASSTAASAGIYGQAAAVEALTVAEGELATATAATGTSTLGLVTRVGSLLATYGGFITVGGVAMGTLLALKMGTDEVASSFEKARLTAELYSGSVGSLTFDLGAWKNALENLTADTSRLNKELSGERSLLGELGSAYSRVSSLLAEYNGLSEEAADIALRQRGNELDRIDNARELAEEQERLARMERALPWISEAEQTLGIPGRKEYLQETMREYGFTGAYDYQTARREIDDLENRIKHRELERDIINNTTGDLKRQAEATTKRGPEIQEEISAIYARFGVKSPEELKTKLEEQNGIVVEKEKELTVALGKEAKARAETVRLEGQKALEDLRQYAREHPIQMEIQYINPGLPREYVGGTTPVRQELQMGTEYVPETGPYLLHRGEKVIPASETGKASPQVVYQNTVNINNPTVRNDEDLQRIEDHLKWALKTRF